MRSSEADVIETDESGLELDRPLTLPFMHICLGASARGFHQRGAQWPRHASRGDSALSYIGSSRASLRAQGGVSVVDRRLEPP